MAGRPSPRSPRIFLNYLLGKYPGVTMRQFRYCRSHGFYPERALEYDFITYNPEDYFPYSIDGSPGATLDPAETVCCLDKVVFAFQMREIGANTPRSPCRTCRRQAHILQRRSRRLRIAFEGARGVDHQAARQRRRRGRGSRGPPRRRRRAAPRRVRDAAHRTARLRGHDLSQRGQHHPDPDRLGLRSPGHLPRHGDAPLRRGPHRLRRQLVKRGPRRRDRSRNRPHGAGTLASRTSTPAGPGTRPTPTPGRRSMASSSRGFTRCARTCCGWRGGFPAATSAGTS